MNKVLNDYRAALEETQNEVVAALLVVAENMPKFDDSFGHEICMGLRKGLFGAHSSDSESINVTFSELAEKLGQ